MVFLSPHFPPDSYPFCLRLRAAGAHVPGIADEAWERLRPELRSALNDSAAALTPWRRTASWYAGPGSSPPATARSTFSARKGGTATAPLAAAFVAATIVACDGLADGEGQVVFEAGLRCRRGMMEAVNMAVEVWYRAERRIPGRLRERFVHSEFFRLPDERPVTLEVNLRPPGGLTVDMRS